MSYKRNTLLAAGLIMLTAHAYAELPQIKPGAMQLNQKQSPTFGKPAQKLNLKADLVIQDVGFTSEFCTNACSAQLRRELGIERLSPEKCSWQVTVKNIGSVSSRAGKANLTYTSLEGAVIKLEGNTPAIRAGGFAVVTIRFNVSNNRFLYRQMNKPFITKVDVTNTTAESNESNNTKSVRIR